MRSEQREAAYVEFVTARRTHLRRLAYALCGDWQVADRALHDALVATYVAWPRLQHEGTEESFARRRILRGHLEPHPAAPDDDRSELLTALLTLPARQRRVVLLRHWLGLTVEETAEDLGMSPHRVRGQDARALAALPVPLTREAR